MDPWPASSEGGARLPNRPSAVRPRPSTDCESRCGVSARVNFSNRFGRNCFPPASREESTNFAVLFLNWSQNVPKCSGRQEAADRRALCAPLAEPQCWHPRRHRGAVLTCHEAGCHGRKTRRVPEVSPEHSMTPTSGQCCNHRSGAADFLRCHLPPAIVRLLADEQPELQDGSFVDDNLRNRHSDRLFRVKLRSGEYIFVIVEHAIEGGPGDGEPSAALPDPDLGSRKGYIGCEARQADRPILALVVVHRQGALDPRPFRSPA